MDLTLNQYENIQTSLNSVADGLLEGQDVLIVMGLRDNIDDLETYLDDVIDETGDLTVIEPEFDLFDMCADCRTLLVWCPTEFTDDREPAPKGYRHVRTGLPDCDE